ncbi:venom serine protease 34-like [Belonocnema kinseyi]|uniref:venom serine protease 34-like n=1 Tax=Belonocnema kinseyi TaxID=2817044 RepID=UPI00143DE9B3|nr:venom serine protease 34-like [Belonocnema kinseyi]
MAIYFQSTQNTRGGRLACYVQAIKSAETCRCGWKKLTIIVGGEKTGVNEFPMMAGLVDAIIVQVFCGTVIISNIYTVLIRMQFFSMVGFIKFTNEIGPACLPFHHNRDSFSGAVVEIPGWGATEFAGPTLNILKKVRVSVINLSKCLLTFPNLVDSQMGALGQGTDACQFDSGGPVLWENPTSGRLVNVGIISYGIACGTKNPSVNIRVSAL